MNRLDNYALTFGKLLGYICILVGILMTYLLLKTVLFGY
ncbi:Uncharacterised protein [uncultured archaeon]|nr:Uncharacterised protein [uncultured archaeon]